MRPRRHRSTTKRRPYPSQKYGAAHRALRARLAPVVATGSVRCARCDQLIAADDDWQLDHKDDGRGWLGASHTRCNARAGWEKMVGQNGNGAYVEETPYRWSRRWGGEAADPPVGTTVNAGRGMVEVYLGSGQWSHPVRFERESA
jgi:hypothetical protein